MPAFLAVLASFLWPLFWKFFGVAKDILKICIDFLIKHAPIIFKWGFYWLIINLTITTISFWLYHFYYGSAFALSHIVTTTTLNIIHITLMWSLFYLLYKFLYKD